MQELFRALSSKSRIQILKLITELRSRKPDSHCGGLEEVCVCKITERLHLAPSTISHHLNALKEAGLLNARREGTWIYYSINERKLEELSNFLLELSGNTNKQCEAESQLMREAK